MLDRNVRRKIERALYNYESNSRIGIEFISDQYNTGLTARLDRIGFGGGVSDPTGNKAIWAAEGNEAARWSEVVRKALEHFKGLDKARFIQFRYFKREKERLTCERLYISRSTYYEWVDDVIVYVAIEAARLGLL